MYVHMYECLPTTLNLEIFGAKIFSDIAKNSKIKNTKIPSLEIIGVYNFGQTLAPENFLLENFLHENYWTRNFLIYMYGTSLTCTVSDNCNLYTTLWLYNIYVYAFLIRLIT